MDIRLLFLSLGCLTDFVLYEKAMGEVVLVLSWF